MPLKVKMHMFTVKMPTDLIREHSQATGFHATQSLHCTLLLKCEEKKI